MDALARLLVAGTHAQGSGLVAGEPGGHTVQLGMAQHGTAQHSTAQHGSEWYGTVQINTAQHSKAQLSTAAADPPRTPSSSAPAAWDKPWLCCWGQQGAGRDHAEAGAQGAHEDRSPHGVARCLAGTASTHSLPQAPFLTRGHSPPLTSAPCL